MDISIITNCGQSLEAWLRNAECALRECHGFEAIGWKKLEKAKVEILSTFEFLVYEKEIDFSQNADSALDLASNKIGNFSEMLSVFVSEGSKILGGASFINILKGSQIKQL